MLDTHTYITGDNTHTHTKNYEDDDDVHNNFPFTHNSYIFGKIMYWTRSLQHHTHHMHDGNNKIMNKEFFSIFVPIAINEYIIYIKKNY